MDRRSGPGRNRLGEDHGRMKGARCTARRAPSPSPLVGEGRGGGVGRLRHRRAPFADPLPTMGRGERPHAVKFIAIETLLIVLALTSAAAAEIAPQDRRSAYADMSPA